MPRKIKLLVFEQFASSNFGIIDEKCLVKFGPESIGEIEVTLALHYFPGRLAKRYPIKMKPKIDTLHSQYF